MSMRQLREFSQGTDFTEFVDGIAKLEIDHSVVQGIVIYLHPIWNKYWRARTFGGFNPNILADTRIPGDFITQILGMNDVQFFDEVDLSWSPRAWMEFCSYMQKNAKNPFLVKVCLLPTTSSTIQSRRALEAYCNNETRFHALVEDRAPATAAATFAGGSRITSPTLGTVGGFLRDQSGTILGLTCGHVGQPINTSISADDVQGAPASIGTVLSANFRTLIPSPSHTLCNPSASAINNVDIALITIGSTHAANNTVMGIGQITDIFDHTKIGSGHNVRMRAAVSGLNPYRVTGYASTYRFLFPSGNLYCFSGLFEIVGRIATGLAASFGATTPPSALPGDSGAWICADDPQNNGSAFCGMLIGVDGNTGYSTFTDEIRNWSNANGHTLTVF
jgi:hypothetical protein